MSSSRFPPDLGRIEPRLPPGGYLELELPEESAAQMLPEEGDDEPRRIRLGRKRSWARRLLSWPWRPWNPWVPGSVEVLVAVIARGEGQEGTLRFRLVVLEKPRALA